MWLGNVLVAENGGRAVSVPGRRRRARDGGTGNPRAGSIWRRGDTVATVWTCDFSYDYVKINAEYRT
jgi:glutamate N-acetyltransferase/amino-acid N-acetyltransferase